MNEKMKVLYIQVGKKPQIIEIKHMRYYGAGDA